MKYIDVSELRKQGIIPDVVMRYGIDKGLDVKNGYVWIEVISSFLLWQAMQTENNGSPVADSERYDIDRASDSALPEAASWYPNTTIFHINKALNDPDKGVREAAIKNPNATTFHIDKALDDTDIDVRYAAINHPNATPNNISKALDRNQPECVRVAAIGHPKVTTKQIEKTLNDKKWWVRIGAVRHPNATLAHINKGLEDSSYIVREAAAKIKKERNL